MATINPVLQVENLTKSFGDLVLFKHISFGLAEGLYGRLGECSDKVEYVRHGTVSE